MDLKKVFLQVIFFLEIVLSARILFFNVPVTISKFMENSFEFKTNADRLIVFTTILAVCYLVAGLVSLKNIFSCKVIHYVSFLVVLGVGLFFFNQPELYQGNIFLISIFAFSTIVTLLVTFVNIKES